MVGGGVKLVLSNYIVMLERKIKYNNIIKWSQDTIAKGKKR